MGGGTGQRATTNGADDAFAAKLQSALETDPDKVAAALEFIGRGDAKALNLEGVTAAAAYLKPDGAKSNVADVLVRALAETRKLKSFRQALAARGLDFAAPLEVPKRQIPAGVDISDALVKGFIPRARRTSCRIYMDGSPKGSGCLIGPTLIMTAWHVVGEVAAGQEQKGRGRIEARLSNGRTYPVVGKLVYGSPTAKTEQEGKLTDEDVDYEGCHDVAILRLATPEGVRLGFNSIGTIIETIGEKRGVLLFHFPAGQDLGFNVAALEPASKFTARWTYNAKAAPGSSGGPCFDVEEKFVGIHNARDPSGSRRLVPAKLFKDDVAPFVESDVAPAFLWRLDDELVIGRDQFFEAIAAAAKRSTRIRGVRIKRLGSEAQGSVGLSFSKLMLQRLLERNMCGHRVIGITFERVFEDLLQEISEHCGQGQSARSEPPDLGTTPQAMTKRRAQELAQTLDEAAGRAGEIWWIFFENAERSLTSGELMAFEEFGAAAIRRPGLRVVIAGFELISTPGPELSGVTAEEDGEPGFMVEIFGRVERRDVEHALDLAARDFGHATGLSPGELDIRTRDVLRTVDDGQSLNERYEAGAIETLKRAILNDLPRLQP